MKFYTREVWVRQKEEPGFIERRRETDVGQTVVSSSTFSGPRCPERCSGELREMSYATKKKKKKPTQFYLLHFIELKASI